MGATMLTWVATVAAGVGTHEATADESLERVSGNQFVALTGLDCAGTPLDPARELRRTVLETVARHPGWDGEQVADFLGEDRFAVLDAVQALIDEGLVGHKRRT